MLLKLFIVLLAVGVNNAQTENAVTTSDSDLRQGTPIQVLTQGLLQMTQLPDFRNHLIRYFYNLGQHPQYRVKIQQIFNYLRHPQAPPKITLTPQLVKEIIGRLRNPLSRDLLIDAFLLHLASSAQPREPFSSGEPWPDMPERHHPLSHIIAPLLKELPLFQAVAHQITQLLQDPELRSTWTQFLLKFEAPIPNRKALLRALYALNAIPEAKPFVTQAIVLTLQHPLLRPIFMKQFFEMLLSRTVSTEAAMAMLKILYTPMPEQEMANQINAVMQEPRIRSRITAMILNIFFEPRLRPLVITILLKVIQHPMFFPVVLYHTQQILIHLINNPLMLDYTLALLRVPQARLLAIKLVLLFMRQPVQVSYMQVLMRQDVVLNQFLREILNTPQVRPVALAIFGVKNMLSNPQMHDRLVPYVNNLLDNPETNVYVASYLLNLYYQPRMTAVIQRLFPNLLISKMHAVLMEEIRIKEVYVHTVKFECEKQIRVLNPATHIPGITLPTGRPIPPVFPIPPLPPRPPPRPPVFPVRPPPPRPPGFPFPPWEPPRPPGFICPPPMVVPVYVPLVPEYESVMVVTMQLLHMVKERSYERVYDTIHNLLLNPLTQHQAVLQLLQQPSLRPFFLQVLQRIAEDPKLLTSMSPTLLAAFRKVAQDTVVFRDILMDRQLFEMFHGILFKMQQPGLVSELFKFWLDFVKNIGVNQTLQDQVISLLNVHGLGPQNMERIGMILRNKSM